jgi:cellulose synthase/poly-beta-1,6-N-acetylglucosamine synthase-like glycosyltransferase
MTFLFVIVYVLSLVGLAIYGLLGFYTLVMYLRYRQMVKPLPQIAQKDLPLVTVQLPIYNEREVVERLIAAACALDYPKDRLQIQVLDDSTDDTTIIAQEIVEIYRQKGYEIDLIHRQNRSGFKAGALSAGLARVKGQFIAIFDADFQPLSTFLRETIPYFLDDNRLGMVQGRWGHLNALESSLTAAQMIALDKHFVIEQTVRFRAEFFPKFNGSAGVWRRECLEDAGGWQEDTVCEDLCLSTRAILRGWRAYFADNVIAPAELPRTILDFKNQQARWAMGSTQCLTKYGREIMLAHTQSRTGRLYSLLSMSAYSTHVLFLLLLFAQLPLLLSDYQPPTWLMILSIFGLGQPILFVLAQRYLYPDWVIRLRHLPTLLLVAVGIAPSNTWAVLQALLGREFTFTRTPKGSNNSYHPAPDRMLAVVFVLALYSASTLSLAIALEKTGPIFFLLFCLLGFVYTAFLILSPGRNANQLPAQ